MRDFIGIIAAVILFAAVSLLWFTRYKKRMPWKHYIKENDKNKIYINKEEKNNVNVSAGN